MKARIVVCVMVSAISMVACHRDNGGGISSGTGGWPPSTTTPAEVSNSGQVVAIRVSSTQIAPGASVDAVVQLSISPGYHVNANPATYPYLIATEITPEKAEGVATDKPKYPPAKKQKFQFAEEPLAVYEGDVDLHLPLKVEAKAGPGERSLPINVRVQACDTEKCFPPATLSAIIPVTIK